MLARLDRSKAATPLSFLCPQRLVFQKFQMLSVTLLRGGHEGTAKGKLWHGRGVLSPPAAAACVSAGNTGQAVREVALQHKVRPIQATPIALPVAVRAVSYASPGHAVRGRPRSTLLHSEQGRTVG